MAEIPKPRAWSPSLPPPQPAIFYGPVEAGNPVVKNFESDLRSSMGFLLRKREVGDDSVREQELHRRGVTALFNIWNKYKPRFPDWYYSEKLVEVGDQLVELKEYKIALSYCYGKYLQQISGINVDTPGLTMQQFRSSFFPNGFRDQSAARTFHVLQVRNTLLYQMVCDNDSELLNQKSVKMCFRLMTTWQLIMQMILPHEHLCWLLYNGTVHMYTICRHLMTIGLSAKVLEYLQWACVCIESSVPLLAVHYLTWRATLYAAVCQCYYDCQCDIHGEIFARRGLMKIDELKQLENMSSSPLSKETKKKFKEATVKMAAMIFKRSAFEPRRRPKGPGRSRVKTNLRDTQHMPWPRTITERLLMEIFDCNSSIFFAILEALFDKNRRTLVPSPPVPDEIEVRDVISELCFAAADILEGGGLCTQGNTTPDVSPGVITASSTLMQQILAGKNGISANAAFRFLKIAFSYEEWDAFDHAVLVFFSFLQRQKNQVWKKAKAELKILLVMQSLLSTRKPRHGLYVQGNNIQETILRSQGRKSITFQDGIVQSANATDELFSLARTLYYCICTSEKIHLPDKEILTDALMFLWQRCKVGIQRIQASGNNFLKSVHKYQTPKWIHTLYAINEIIHTIHLGEINAVVMAEVSLRLASVIESIAEFTVISESTSATNDSLLASEYSIGAMPSLLQKSPPELLYLAYEYLDVAINAMNQARLENVDGTSVLDNCCKKMTVSELNLNTSPSSDTSEKSIAGNFFIMDLHIELIQSQHRVAVKLLNLGKGVHTSGKNIKGNIPARHLSQFKYLTEPDIMNKVKKNRLSKALYLMQKATLMLPEELGGSSPSQLLEEALTLIQKTEAEQNAFCATSPRSARSVESKVPPPPILLSRSHCSVAFKPVPFALDDKVCWYSIFGCLAEGCNPKVRLNNYSLKNTGIAVPTEETCVLEVKDLEPNQKYIFAVAAYDSDGNLIGDNIGETTKPILAYAPLSAVTVRAYLIQSAFQVENYTLCKKAFQSLWDYFVSEPCTPVTDVKVVSASSTLTMPQNRLIPETLVRASPILLNLFTRNIFIINYITVNEGGLFCDSVCFNDLKYSRQVARITGCGRMLVAIELSSWLNDVNYALQSVVYCYGLIAPFVYHKIPSEPVMQVIIKCLTVLQEISNITLQRRPRSCYESLQHMIACCCVYAAKILRSWKEYELAIFVINCGKKLLDSSQTASQMAIAGEGADEFPEDEVPSKRLKAQMAAAEKVNENLEALENNLLRLTKPGQELSGDEDSFLLYPVVSNWQTKSAIKEVMKFKKSPRFLEYFVKLIYKALNEDKFPKLLEWAEEVQDYIRKRNRFILGIKTSPRKKKSYGPAEKKKTGTLEFNKMVVSPRRSKSPKKKEQFKYSDKCPGKSYDAERREKEESHKLAVQMLVHKLNLRSNVFLKRRRFRWIYIEEMPWRSQLNIYLAIIHFTLFKKRTEDLCHVEIHSLQNLNSYDELDPEIFSLNNSGTILVAATVEEDVKPFKPTLLKTPPPSGKSQKKSDILDLTSPAFDSGPSLPASDRTLQSASSDTVSTSSLPDDSDCLTHEADAMMDSTVSHLSSSFLDTDSAVSSEYSTRTTSEKDTPRAIQSHIPIKERERAQCCTAILEHFSKTFLYFRRAVVIAHRGGHWTLLQNACRDLWNYTQEVQSIIKHSESFNVSFPITKEIFLNTVWLPYYMAADVLLDMIVDLQDSNSVKIIEPEGDFYVPSCVGGIADDNGGYNLSFQYPFDDMNVVDLQGVCNLVLRTLEFLFHLKKWESLIYIAMQFNSITHERYTEQVTSLLVFAQRQLQGRAENLISDLESSQVYFKHLVTKSGDKVCCRNFVEKKLHSIVKYNSRADEDHFDSSDVNQSMLLFSVPVDVADTLKCFRASLEKSKHHGRSLKYSRKLLSLFLAHTQDFSGKLNTPNQVPSGKVEFVMGAELTYHPQPPDLSEETFSYPSMVQSNAIPQSKLSVVISSYEKTIEALETKNQQGLKVQALHELGNLYFFTGNKRVAFKCWCQGLDGALKIVDALNHWQEFDDSSENATDSLANRSQDICEKFVTQAGIWGCLQGAVLAAKIAQHILFYDVNFRTRTCILSAVLFKSLFRASLPHPKVDCDFAQYETEILIPGIDLFVDRYRADIGTVVASLNFVIYELHCNKQNLIILPLFTLYQYFVSEICRDSIRCIEGRILKIKVLTDLGFFSDAFCELCILNRGEKIPWKLPSVYMLIPKLPVSPKFDLSQPLLAVVNLQVLEDVFNRSLHSGWMPVCEPRIMNNLMLAKMHFIISLAETLNCIPEKVMKVSYCTDSETLRKAGKNTDAFVKGFMPANAFTSGRREPSIVIVELEKNKDTLNMAMLKGILLEEAEERINSVLETIQTKHGSLIQECSASELEIVIEAKLQLAAIAQQRLQTAFSAALAFSSIKFLQDASVLKKESSVLQPKDKTYEANSESICTDDSRLFHNIIAQKHMNIHVWLKCRLALVSAITAQARGIETMKENELTECSSLITEVQLEAQAFNDIETVADITMQAVMLGLQEKQPVADIKLCLQEIIRLLEEKTLISPPAALTLAKSMLLLADIMSLQAEGDTVHPMTDQLSLLFRAHALVIKQLFLLGQSLEQHAEDPTLTTLNKPLKNIYLPHISLLAKVKMRIGHTLALELSCMSNPQRVLQWLQAHKHMEMALNLSKASARRDLELEAELLFRKGKIERQIDSLGGNKSTLAVESLIDAINVSLSSYQNYGLIRRSYMEIALQYFFLITNKEEFLTLSTLKGTIFKPNPGKRHRVSSEEITAPEMYRVLAWIAVRAAAQVSEAVLASQQLSGKKAVKVYPVRHRVLQNMPEFALLDLSSSYKDFLTEGYEVRYKVPMMPSTQQEISESIGAESVSSDESQEKLKILWVHVIRYNTYLTRLLNMSPLIAVPKAGEGLFVKEDTLFTSVFDTTIALRLAELHSFLKIYLPIYSGCCLQEPPKQLFDNEKHCFSLTVLEKSQDSSAASSKTSLGKIFRSYSSDTDFNSENKATSTPIRELCVQWYLPSLEKSPEEGETMFVLLQCISMETTFYKASVAIIWTLYEASRLGFCMPHTKSEFIQRPNLWNQVWTLYEVLFIFAYNKKPVKIMNIKSFNSTNIYCGYLWIPLNRVIALREKLSDLKQHIEFLIQSKMIPQTVAEVPKEIPLTASKPDVEKVSLDSKAKEMVKQCFSEITDLLSIGSDSSSLPKEIPFDVTLPIIQNLRKLFDPANGCVITAGNVLNWIVSFLT